MSKKNSLQIDYLHPRELKDYHRQLHIISNKQIAKARHVLQECGFITPIPIGKDNVILHGQFLVEAARSMGMDAIPVVRHGNLSEQQERIIRIALDRIAEDSEWNKSEMSIELNELLVDLPDLSITGFEDNEIGIFLDLDSSDSESDGKEDMVPTDETAITQEHDLWIMGDHKLLCGDALKEGSYQALLGDERAQMVFTDSPYNVAMNGHAGGKGKIKPREFVQASGEMSTDEFTVFETTFHQYVANYCQDGAIIFSCMDWRHIREIIDAAQTAKLEMINLICWCKDNAGMGSLYRSQHELVFVFKKGKAKHINNVQLGSNGRYRTNVWQYPGVNSFGGGRMEELEMHPTVKPMAMVVDAIKDCSKRGGVILDPFGGSGTTLMAAEKTGRKARLIELDPLYCDVTVRRWQELTGKDAIHAETGITFNETLATLGGQDDE